MEKEEKLPKHITFLGWKVTTEGARNERFHDQYEFTISLFRDGKRQLHITLDVQKYSRSVKHRRWACDTEIGDTKEFAEYLSVDARGPSPTGAIKAAEKDVRKYVKRLNRVIAGPRSK